MVALASGSMSLFPGLGYRYFGRMVITCNFYGFHSILFSSIKRSGVWFTLCCDQLSLIKSKHPLQSAIVYFRKRLQHFLPTVRITTCISTSLTITTPLTKPARKDNHTTPYMIWIPCSDINWHACLHQISTCISEYHRHQCRGVSSLAL